LWRKLAALTALGFALGCAHQAATTPPVTAEAPGALPGKFVWHDLVTDDPAACSRFYSSLLGWEFEHTQRLGRSYQVARLDGRRVAGMVPIDAKGAERPSQWVGYVSVPDVDRAVDAVARAGGRALVGPLDVPAGRAAVIADPQGAALGLVRLAQGDPPDEASPRENGFFWMEYLAGDPSAALGFYSDLVGYQAEITDTGIGTQYHVLRRGRARAGLLPAPRQGVHPTWLAYVLVKDPAGLAARAEPLGGKVLLAPRADLRKGTLAIVADPSGAALALQKWPL
jgi:predicted enzyme related to lactoylglutathione lyase